jgi:hypothetical protein
VVAGGEDAQGAAVDFFLRLQRRDEGFDVDVGVDGLEGGGGEKMKKVRGGEGQKYTTPLTLIRFVAAMRPSTQSASAALSWAQKSYDRLLVISEKQR